MRKTAGVVVVTSALLGAFACGSFGAADDGADAGASGGDAAASSSSSSGGTPSGDGGGDGGDDIGGTGPDMPASVFADPGFDDDEFDDFERGGLPGNGPLGWLEKVGPEGNVGSVTALVGAEACTLTGCSASNVYWCKGSSAAWGFMTTELENDKASYLVRFVMNFATDSSDNRPPVGVAQVMSFELGAVGHFVYLEVAGTTLRLADQIDGVAYTTVLGDLVPGAFARYALYVDFAAGLAALARNEVQLGPTRRLRANLDRTPVRLRAGLTFVAGDSYHVRYDDIGADGD